MKSQYISNSQDVQIFQKLNLKITSRRKQHPGKSSVKQCNDL